MNGKIFYEHLNVSGNRLCGNYSVADDRFGIERVAQPFELLDLLNLEKIAHCFTWIGQASEILVMLHNQYLALFRLLIYVALFMFLYVKSKKK